jgi:hypothetical protein
MTLWCDQKLSALPAVWVNSYPLSNLFLALTSHLKILCPEKTEPPQNLKRWGLESQNAIPGSSQHAHKLKHIWSTPPLTRHSRPHLISFVAGAPLHRTIYSKLFMETGRYHGGPSIEAATGAPLPDYQCRRHT